MPLTSTPRSRAKVRHVIRWSLVVVWLLAGAGTWGPSATAQVRATVRPGSTPLWTKGILPISPESYYHAIECGSQGGEDPPCVFWDTGLCANEDFTLAAHSAYKQVAYEVWGTVRNGRPAPQPDFQAARQTRVTISATPIAGANNPLTDLVLTRGGEPARPVDRSVSGGGGRATYDYAAWAPTAAVTLDLVGAARTISCIIEPAVLQQFR